MLYFKRIKSIFIFLVFCSCTTSFNYDSSEKLINELKNQQGKISALHLNGDIISINNVQTTLNKTRIQSKEEFQREVLDLKKYLIDIDVTEKSFNKLIKLLEETEVKGFYYNDDITYLITDSFLSDSGGKVYTNSKIVIPQDCSENSTIIQGVRICITKKINEKWYEAIARH